MLTVSLVLALTLGATTEPDPIWAGLRSHYLGLTTLSGTFTETICAEGEGTCRSFEGRFDIRLPDHYRLEVTEPEQQLIIGTDSLLWFHFPTENRAVRHEGAQSVPLMVFIEPVTDTATVVVLTTNEYGATVVEVESEEEMAAFYDLKLELSDAGTRVDAFEFNDPLGNHYHFRLRGQIWNEPISDETFRFSPPAGTEVE